MNFGGIQDLVLQIIGLMIVIIGGLVIWTNRNGKVRETANTVGVIVLGAVIIFIGTAMLFPQIGRSLGSIVFG